MVESHRRAMVDCELQFLSSQMFGGFREVQHSSNLIYGLLEYLLLYRESQHLPLLLHCLKPLPPTIETSLKSAILTQNLPLLDSLQPRLLPIFEKLASPHGFSMFAQLFHVNFVLLSADGAVNHIETDPLSPSLYVLESTYLLYPHPMHYKQPLFKEEATLLGCLACTQPVPHSRDTSVLCQDCANSLSFLPTADTSQSQPISEIEFTLDLARTRARGPINPQTSAIVMNLLKNSEQQLKTHLEEFDHQKTQITAKVLNLLETTHKKLEFLKTNVTEACEKLMRHPKLETFLRLEPAEALSLLAPTSLLTFQFHEDSLDSLLTLDFPLANLLQSFAQCSLCDNSSKLLETACGCFLCPQCLIANSQTCRLSCVSCHSKVRSPAPILTFLQEYKQSQVTRLAGDFKRCYKCEGTIDADVVLHCECRLCMECCSATKSYCPLCGVFLNTEDWRAIKTAENAVKHRQMCEHCGRRQRLVCSCACSECAVKFCDPPNRRCLHCTSPFKSSFYAEVKLQFLQVPDLSEHTNE